MSAHTPGPWKAATDNPNVIEFSSPTNGDWGGMNIVWRGVNRVTGEIITAGEKACNMRLIAAAPDLLEACKLADLNLTAQDDAETLIVKTEIVLRFVRLAIAKAEGRS